MLSGLVSPDAARLYLRLVRGGPLDGEGGDGSRAALAELDRLGLVRAAPGPAGGPRAVDPAEAFSRLLAGVDQQLATRQAELGRLLRVLDGLRLDGEAATVSTVEVLTDPVAVSRTVRQATISACTEYLAVVAAGAGDQPSLGWPDGQPAGDRTPDEWVAYEYARVRLLYAGCAPPPGAEPDASPGHLAEVRHGPPAPLDIRVIDQHTALLALAATPVDGVRSAAVVRSEPIVGLLRTCFHLLWYRASTVAGRPGGAATPFDRRVVTLLAAGHRDADIASATGTSVRTVRRRITAISQELGAESRFAAGVEAYRRGMVDP